MKRGLLIWRLGVLIFVCLFADSASSTPPNVEQKSQTHTKDKEQPTITDRRGTESSPVFIKVLPPLPVEPNPAEHAQRSSEYTSPEWWLVWVTLSLAAITAFLAVYTAKLWGATKSLAEEAKETAARQASEMQASLGIAKESANAARNSVELAREEFIATYCPRLIIRRIKVYQANDVPLEIHYELANIGGTRAKVVEISARLWLPDIQKSYFPPVPPYAIADKPLNIVVESGAPYQGRHKVDLTEDIEEYALRWSYTEGVMRDQHSSMDAYFLGYIVYLDQLDRRFETAFLREYNFFTKRFTPVDDPDYEYRA